MPSEKDDRELFVKAYATGQKPWDSGLPCPELVRVLDAGLLHGKTLLEIGCGTGTNAIELAKRGYHVTAFDYVEQAVEAARGKIKDAGVKIELRVGDATKDHHGGPYDAIFDRGVYHHVRRVDLKGFLTTVERSSRKGTRWLSLAGSAKEKHEYGPPTVHEHELRAELEPLFKILELREFRFGTDKDEFRPLAWSILMERK
jgi:SAM-dependent methyltransferase